MSLHEWPWGSSHPKRVGDTDVTRYKMRCTNVQIQVNSHRRYPANLIRVLRLRWCLNTDKLIGCRPCFGFGTYPLCWSEAIRVSTKSRTSDAPHLSSLDVDASTSCACIPWVRLMSQSTPWYQRFATYFERRLLRGYFISSWGNGTTYLLCAITGTEEISYFCAIPSLLKE